MGGFSDGKYNSFILNRYSTNDINAYTFMDNRLKGWNSIQLQGEKSKLAPSVATF